MREYRLFIVIAIATGLSWAAHAEDHAVFEQIEQQNNVFEKAFSSGDGAAIGALYTETGTILPPDQAAIVGREAIGQFWQGVIDSGVARVELLTDEVDDQDDTAFEVSRFEMYDSEDALIAAGKYIVVWKRSGDIWQLHRDIWNAGN